MGLNNKKMIALYPAIIFLLAIDRLFKSLALNGVLDEPVGIIGGLLKLSFSKNFNIAFSIPLGGPWLNYFILVIILALIYYLSLVIIKYKDYWQGVFLILIILGAASNLFDRIELGYVIDYIDLKYFTVFNVADIMIVGGVAGILLLNPYIQHSNATPAC